MTFDGPSGTTWGSYLAYLRDTVAALDGWSIAKDNTNGESPISSTPGVFWVWENPYGDYIEMKRSGNVKFEVWMGPDYDLANESWNDEYQGMPALDGDEWDPVDERSLGTQVSHVTYHDDADGFVSYCRTTEGTINEDGVIGFAEITDLWDYANGANREAEMGYIQQGTASSDVNYWTQMPESLDRRIDDKATGMTNPDANFSNYPMYIPNWVRSSQFENGNGNSAVLGSHDLYLKDESGGQSAHLDTIQDDQGNDAYKIVKGNGSTPDMAIKMG
ncbi:hypothetical protein ACOJIV_14290 [Haloarcula sp. AONF1]